MRVIKNEWRGVLAEAKSGILHRIQKQTEVNNEQSLARKEKIKSIDISNAEARSL